MDFGYAETIVNGCQRCLIPTNRNRQFQTHHTARRNRAGPEVQHQSATPTRRADNLSLTRPRTTGVKTCETTLVSTNIAALRLLYRLLPTEAFTGHHMRKCWTSWRRAPFGYRCRGRRIGIHTKDPTNASTNARIAKATKSSIGKRCRPIDLETSSGIVRTL